MVTHIIHYVDEDNIHRVCCVCSLEVPQHNCLDTFPVCLSVCVSLYILMHAVYCENNNRCNINPQ